MKDMYKTPEIEITEFECEDVITTSNEGPDGLPVDPTSTKSSNGGWATY
jgi:hypothetical protein